MTNDTQSAEFAHIRAIKARYEGSDVAGRIAGLEETLATILKGKSAPGMLAPYLVAELIKTATTDANEDVRYVALIVLEALFMKQSAPNPLLQKTIFAGGPTPVQYGLVRQLVDIAADDTAASVRIAALSLAAKMIGVYPQLGTLGVAAGLRRVIERHKGDNLMLKAAQDLLKRIEERISRPHVRPQPLFLRRPIGRATALGVGLPDDIH